MNKTYKIGQNDLLPKLFATLGAVYDDSFPDEEKIVYNTGDVIKLYIDMDAGWVTRDATVVKSIQGGRAVKVSVQLPPEDVETDGTFDCYFRNETIGMSFPIGEYGKVIVEERGKVSV